MGGRSHRRPNKRALFLCALPSIAKDAIYTFDKTQTYSLWARPQTENGQLLTGSLLPFCGYQKWRLVCNQNSETTFQYKVAPITHTLRSRIGPKKNSKLLSTSFLLLTLSDSAVWRLNLGREVGGGSKSPPTYLRYF